MQIKWIVDNIRAFSFVLTNWNKEPDKERIYRWGEFFHKLDNTKWKICIVGRMYFSKKKKNSKRHVKLEQKTRRRKNLSLNRVFHKLDNNKWKMHTGARAKEQKYIYLSIYLSLWKPFWKRVCVYIYIYIYVV